MSNQNAALRTMLHAAERGLETVEADSVAGRRLADMHSFYTHLMRELPAIIDRWRAGKSGGR